MGSSGMKKNRKGNKRQHLPKVGTHTTEAARREQHLEREAALDVMGLSNLGGAGKVIAWIVFGIVAVCAILALLVLIVL